MVRAATARARSRARTRSPKRLRRLGPRPDKSLVAPGIAKELGVRRLLLPTFPYAVVVMMIDDTVHVVAFAHLKKKPNYWRGRLRRLLKPAPSKKR